MICGAVLPNSAIGALVLTSGIYTQDFNSIGTSLPENWDVRTSATSSTLGNVATYSSVTTTWGDAGGAFKNLSSTNISYTSSSTAQRNNANRALGVRQTGAFGEPGASFNFNFSTVDLTVQSIRIDLLMLSVQDRSTTWSIQYGLGASPTTFTTLGTWSDPAAFGTTSFSFNTANFGNTLNHQTQVWFRVAALSASSGNNSRDTIAIDQFSITTIPEPGVTLLGALSMLAVLRRRREDSDRKYQR